MKKILAAILAIMMLATAFISGACAEPIADGEFNINFCTWIGYAPLYIAEAILMGTKIFVMSRCPGRIKSVLDVNLPGERSHKSMMLPQFLEIKTHIMELIWEESRAAANE